MNKKLSSENKDIIYGLLLLVALIAWIVTKINVYHVTLFNTVYDIHDFVAIILLAIALFGSFNRYLKDKSGFSLIITIFFAIGLLAGIYRIFIE